MKTIAVIPARMGSTRFPGKPMAEILGMPMIGHVYTRVKLTKELDEVVVATCDKVIFDYIESIGGRAVMTSDTHTRCTDRTAEAVNIIESKDKTVFDLVVMVQGDEPMVTSEMITLACQPFINGEDVNVVNLVGDIESEKDFEDPNEVKVVHDRNFNALYFSREAIPSRKKTNSKIPMKKQVCIIPFKRDFLDKFNNLEETELEIIESVDMMRVLEHGMNVRLVPFKGKNVSVDTPNDLTRAEKEMKIDNTTKKYLI
jgi:3-deoxy-manno-octulosonate cytidylyltransferase (CMP-KDO synthetase)